MSVIVSALLAAVFSGIAAVLVTLGIERFGGVVGGVLATIPSTIVPASLGLAYAHGPDDVWISMFMVPGKLRPRYSLLKVLSNSVAIQLVCSLMSCSC